METGENFDDGLYPTDDIYGATSDFWGDSDNEQEKSSDSDGSNAPQTARPDGTDKTPS